jgi:hypothetical protein
MLYNAVLIVTSLGFPHLVNIAPGVYKVRPLEVLKIILEIPPSHVEILIDAIFSPIAKVTV